MALSIIEHDAHALNGDHQAVPTRTGNPTITERGRVWHQVHKACIAAGFSDDTAQRQAFLHAGADAPDCGAEAVGIHSLPDVRFNLLEVVRAMRDYANAPRGSFDEWEATQHALEGLLRAVSVLTNAVERIEATR